LIIKGIVNSDNKNSRYVLDAILQDNVWVK
jgi:hypothetical protein